MKLSEQDYRVVIGESALKIISQASEDIRTRAEQEAMSEIAGYLRPKYDTDAIFSAQDTRELDPYLVMIIADVALYHMVSALPQKMGSEVRKERYENALHWLQGVSAGRIVPNLPLAVDGDGNPSGTDTAWNAQQKLNPYW